jgi:glycosyltransferase involved in cell wall biosynthesis
VISEREILILIPAFNEEARLGTVIKGVRRHLPETAVLVVDDGSSDGTATVGRAEGACIVRHPFNLGVGTALQTGYKFAVKNGYKYVIQLDADGQHPPEYLPWFIAKLKETEADLIVGSRFLNDSDGTMSVVRKMGNRLFARLLSLLINEKLTDPTSGYRALKSTVLQFCVQDQYAFDYPDADFLLTLHRSGFRIEEIPVRVDPRSGGISQHAGLKPVFYTIKMMISLLVIMLRKKTAKKR